MPATLFHNPFPDLVERAIDLSLDAMALNVRQVQEIRSFVWIPQTHGHDFADAEAAQLAFLETFPPVNRLLQNGFINDHEAQKVWKEPHIGMRQAKIQEFLVLETAIAATRDAVRAIAKQEGKPQPEDLRVTPHRSGRETYELLREQLRQLLLPDTAR